MHHAIPPGSNVWWLGLFSSVFIVALPLLFTRQLKTPGKELAGRIMGFTFLGTFVALHLYQIHQNTWSASVSLPLQLCALSSILSGLIFFYRRQLLFEALVYWGIAGAIHSILTPELVYGHDLFYIAEYYVAHAGILASALYLPMRLNHHIRQGSWWQLWIYTQPVLLIVGLINFMTSANYMYLCKKPMAENPFVMGDWPWYIIGLELAGLLHFWLIYRLYKQLGWVRPTTP